MLALSNSVEAMGRREFVSFVGGVVVAWSVSVNAQPTSQPRRIGVLMPYADDPVSRARLLQFVHGLEMLGWSEGRDVRIDYYFANSDLGRMRAYAAELVAIAPDVIFAASPQVLAALKQQTSSIPVVFVNVTDPVGVGLVQSLSHPGGNMTGFGAYEFSIAGKWVELLKQIAPSLARVAVVTTPQHATNAKLLQSAQSVGKSMKLEVVEASVRNSAEIETAIGALAAEPDSGMLVLPSPVTTDHQELIVQLAARYKLPAIYPYRDLAQGGGLISYGPNLSDDYRSAASYVDRILRGERPTNLPVQAPTRFEIFLNLGTARALGLTVPQSLLSTADEIIE
jgi:putative tryptophan/tyrosine transport system substrate-binding protein